MPTGMVVFPALSLASCPLRYTVPMMAPPGLTTPGGIWGRYWFTTVLFCSAPHVLLRTTSEEYEA